jgi:hypothetical protein
MKTDVLDKDDPWDMWLVVLGRHMFEQSAKSRWKHKTWKPAELAKDDQKCFEQGLSWHAGGEIDERFTAYDPQMTGMVRVSEKPAQIVSPEMLRKMRAEKSRYVIEHLAVGQVDGPGTCRCGYIARVWDTKLESEIAGSRFSADKLSWAIAAAYEKIPTS